MCGEGVGSLLLQLMRLVTRNMMSVTCFHMLTGHDDELTCESVSCGSGPTTINWARVGAAQSEPGQLRLPTRLV